MAKLSFRPSTMTPEINNAPINHVQVDARTGYFYDRYKMKLSNVSVAFALIACLSSCTSSAKNNDIGEQVHIIFQVCAVGRNISENIDLLYQTITHSGYGGFRISLDKYTELGEPVYYNHSGSPSDTIAIVSSLSDESEKKYVYLAPSGKLLTYGTWSAWVKPNYSTTDERAEGELLRGIVLSSETTDSSAPISRYKLLKFNEFLGTRRKRSSAALLLEDRYCGV